MAHRPRTYDYGKLGELARRHATEHPGTILGPGPLSKLYNAATGQKMSDQACRYIMNRYPELFPSRPESA